MKNCILTVAVALLFIGCAESTTSISNPGSTLSSPISSSDHITVQSSSAVTVIALSSSSATVPVFSNSSLTASQLAVIDTNSHFDPTILATNYAKTVTASQIAADLKLIVKYNRAIKSSEVPTASLPGAGCVNLGADQVSSFGGVTYLSSIKFLDMDGVEKQLCGESDTARADQTFAAMFADGSVVSFESEEGPNATYYATSTTVLQWSTTPILSSSKGTANYTVTSPDEFHMFAESELKSSQASASATAITTGYQTLWFQKGVYKCNVPIESSTSAYVCDLLNNEIKVGTYSIDSLKLLTVKDAAGVLVP